MSLRSGRWASLLLVALVASAGDLIAQVVLRPERMTVSGSAAFATRLLWRGITRYPGPAAQVASDVRFTTGRLSVEGSLWSTAVTGACPDQLAACPVSRDPRIAELTGQLGVGVRLGAFRLITGATWMRAEPSAFDAGRRRSATTELFLSAASEPRPLFAWGLQARLDVDEVDGGYLEGWVTVPVTIPIPARPTWFITGVAGYSRGMTKRGSAAGYYDEDGFTHLLGELTIPLLGCRSCDRSRYSVEVFGQLNGNIDEATRRRSPWDGREKDQRGVAGLVVRGTLPVWR